MLEPPITSHPKGKLVSLSSSFASMEFMTKPKSITQSDKTEEEHSRHQKRMTIIFILIIAQ